jgi:HEPN domain-containing protein
MLRKQTNEQDPTDWFEFAAERIGAADILHLHDGFMATGIEALQEGVERYLKGYLIAKGWRLVKTHDLAWLIRAAKNFDPAFWSFAAFAEELTEDFFAQHYPGEDTTLLGQNYDKLRERTGELIALIKRNLPEFFPPIKN